MNRFLHTNMKSILIGLMISMASFLSPTVATGQTGFWTDEGNYDPDWPSVDDIDGNYYNIRNEADLAAFARLVNTGEETFKDKIVRIYETHIDLKDHYWVPIVEFEGTFDGMEHRCENVIIDVNQLNDSSEKRIKDLGFFVSNYGTIKNVSLQSMHIIGHDIDYDLNIGGIAVVNEEGAVIDNCIVFDDEEKLPPIQTSLVDIKYKEDAPYGYSAEIGGICWWNQKNAVIKNCRNQKPIRCDYTETEGIGGIAYSSDGRIENCSNTKEIYAKNGSAAGIANGGHLNSLVNCTNEGYIHGRNAYGIVVVSAKCTNCTNKGMIEATDDAIGICGYNQGICTNNTNSGRIIGTTAVGIVRENDGYTLKNCTNTGNIEGTMNAAGIVFSNRSVYNQHIKVLAAISVSQCINYGNVTATNNDGSARAGGICYKGELLDNCRNYGEVKAKAPMSAYAGGIIAEFSGKGDELIVSYCYNTKSVSAEAGKGNSRDNCAVAGGIACEAAASTIINSCFNLGNISSINHSTLGGPYLGCICKAGGIAGSVYNGDGTITDCYSTGDISVQSIYIQSSANGIGQGGCINCFSTGTVISNGREDATRPTAYGIGGNEGMVNAGYGATNCLALNKNIISNNLAYKVADNAKEQNNYASRLVKIESLGQNISDQKGCDGLGDHGNFWYYNMAEPINSWPNEAWDKSDNTILPQLKYADGTLMPDQPRLLKSDYATETPSDPVDPSDATLKSLSYKIGEDGEVIPVPGFQPDVFHYQISYDKSLTGSTFYAVAEANNPKATVTTVRDDALGRGFVSVSVESEDGKESSTYSIFGVETGDEDKCYLVLNLGSHMGDHMTLELNGKAFRGDAVYKAVPGEQIVGKLVPDKGYKLPGKITEFDGFMMGTISRGETDMYTSDGTIRFTLNGHKLLYASAQEGEETGPPSVGSKLTDEPFVYEVLPENRLKLLHPTQSSEEWRVSSCDVPASVRYRGVDYQVTEIASKAFEDYTNLKIITLSEGLLSIGAFAFDNSGLTRLSLPASVTFIGDEEGDWDLFGDCPNLQAVTVAEGSKTYSASDSILYNKDRSRLILCPPACPHSEVRVPDEVKEIMPYAFAYSKNVAGLTLPAGLEKIGEFAFASSALGKEKSYIRCLGEQPVTFEDTEFLLLLSSTQEEESYLLASNNGKYPCTLYVPAGTKAAYEAAFFWKNFPIQEELPSGDVTISGGDGKIEVEDENGEKVEVEDGVIGNDDLPTVIERISIDIRASSSETTKLVFKQVTVGDGQVVTQETTTTTEIKEETNVSITIEGENVLGKLVNNGIAALLTGSKDGSLSNTVVVNYNTFTSETKLVSKVEGAAPLDVSDPENKTVVAGGSTTLVASTTVESSFNLTFVWERWVDGAWQKVDERKYENLLRSSADKQEDKLTVSAADAGLYRCRITNTVGDASTTLITTPAEVKLTSSGEDPTPTPSETYYDIVVPELTGATTNPAAGKHTVKEGDNFSFTLTLDADYSQSKPEVKAGDQVLVADANGKYTVPNVRGDLTITITGITLNNPTANAEVEQPVKVWAEGTTLHIYTEKRETIRLYTFSGQLLKQMDNAGRIAITGLPEGNYLIRIGNRTWKIAL